VDECPRSVFKRLFTRKVELARHPEKKEKRRGRKLSSVRSQTGTKVLGAKLKNSFKEEKKKSPNLCGKRIQENRRGTYP